MTETQCMCLSQLIVSGRAMHPNSGRAGSGAAWERESSDGISSRELRQQQQQGRQDDGIGPSYGDLGSRDRDLKAASDTSTKPRCSGYLHKAIKVRMGHHHAPSSLSLNVLPHLHHGHLGSQASWEAEPSNHNNSAPFLRGVRMYTKAEFHSGEAFGNSSSPPYLWFTPYDDLEVC